MTTDNRIPAKLLLEDGTMFVGTAIGKIGTKGGEICFNTGMTGYQEIYTDPSYYGQIVVNTTSHIGNYGVIDDEQESATPKISALVVNNFSEDYSRKIARDALQSYLENNQIVGIADVDTRKLVRHIRSKGAMNAIISSEVTDVEALQKLLEEVPNMAGLELSSEVTTKEPYLVGDESSATYKVAALDLGIKTSILKNLVKRGCVCKIFPARTSLEEMEKWQPDGYFISNGPGDPEPMEYAIKTVQEIIEMNKPLFGICLGHQILGLAVGIPTFKMHHGHRGLNHPVKNLISGKCEVTSQNHGFSVNWEAAEQSDMVDITHLNLNDNSVAGLKIKNKPAFSVQYHPESAPGPHDSRYLFDDFTDLMKQHKK